MKHVYVTQPAALAHLMRVPDKVTPWVELWHPGTTLAAVASPQQGFFDSWVRSIACLKVAELRCDLNAEHDNDTHGALCAGGGSIVLVARIGPNYSWKMPSWNWDHYQAIWDHAQEWKSRLEKSWGRVEVAIDTELAGDLGSETFPLDYFTGLERYDYYLPVYETKVDRPMRQPHLWLQYVIGPVERARQIVPCYHIDQECPEGYMAQRNFGVQYGHDLEKILSYENALLYFPPEDEVRMCRAAAEHVGKRA